MLQRGAVQVIFNWMSGNPWISVNSEKESAKMSFSFWKWIILGLRSPHRRAVIGSSEGGQEDPLRANPYCFPAKGFRGQITDP